MRDCLGASFPSPRAAVHLLTRKLLPPALLLCPTLPLIHTTTRLLAHPPQPKQRTSSARSPPPPASDPGCRSGGRAGAKGGKGGRGRGKQPATSTSTSTPAAGPASAAEDAESSADAAPSRGGLCVHRPAPEGGGADPHEEYLSRSRGYLLQTAHPRGKRQIAAIWDGPARERYHAEARAEPEKEPGRKGGRRKRKAAAAPDGEAAAGAKSAKRGRAAETAPQVGGPGQDDRPPPQQLLPLCGLEDDEPHLLALRTGHRGDAAGAELAMLVQSDRGMGVQLLRQARRRRREEREEGEDGGNEEGAEEGRRKARRGASDSWKARVADELRPGAMLGDLRSASDPRYHYHDPRAVDDGALLDTSRPWRLLPPAGRTAPARDGGGVIRHRLLTAAWAPDELDAARPVWDAIGLYAADALARMDAAGGKRKAAVANDDKVRLDDLVGLLHRADSLPAPEEAFGESDDRPARIADALCSVLDAVDAGRKSLAGLLEALQDDGRGVDLAELQKTINGIEQGCPVGLPQLEVVRKQAAEAKQWEDLVADAAANAAAPSSSAAYASSGDAPGNDGDDEALTEKKLSLVRVERLVRRGELLSLRPAGLVRLRDRAERARALRRRVVEWNEARSAADDTANVRFVSGLIKQANKIDLAFPELFTLTGVHRRAEEWMDRASVAVRSTISYDELEDLVETGKVREIIDRWSRYRSFRVAFAGELAG